MDQFSKFGIKASFGLLLAGSLAFGAKSMDIDIVNAKGESTGKASVAEMKGGVRIKGSVKGMPEGEHGIHLHETGSCTPPDFKSAGAHFNPTTKKHGKLNPEGAHVGDMGNVKVNAKGTGTFNIAVEGATLDQAPTSLVKPGGTAMVIHAMADDNKTDPSGNSGDRVACAVIQAK